MRNWLLVAMWLLTSEVAAATDYVRIRTAIGAIESRNDPAALNPRTSASGKYQFMKRWNTWFLRNSGTSWSAVVPKKTAPRSVKSKMSRRQDVLFDTYYERHVMPWIRRVRARGLGEKLTDGELVALAHRQGTGGADMYLVTGKDPFAGKYGNKHITAHLANFRRAMGAASYIEAEVGQ